MQKKLLVLAVSAMTLMGVATGSMAAEKVKLSPFTDKLVISFDGFDSDTLINNSYQDDNGINIEGPAFMNTDGDALVKISSNNLAEPGYPSMTMQYPDRSGTSQTCTLTFLDGPLIPYLIYKDDVAPVCPGIHVGNIVHHSGGKAYTLVITDNEPV